MLAGATHWRTGHRQCAATDLDPNAALLASTAPADGFAEAPSPVPCVLRLPQGQLSMFTTRATFDTPRDITLDELGVEQSGPADQSTGAWPRALPMGSGAGADRPWIATSPAPMEMPGSCPQPATGSVRDDKTCVTATSGGSAPSAQSGHSADAADTQRPRLARR
jgi:hypothetical protein